MKAKEIFKSQYRASLEMLTEAIVRCPEALWYSPAYKNPFWHVAYHVIFYTHFYLHASEESFVPWEKHRPELVSLGGPPETTKNPAPFGKEEILAYLGQCMAQLGDQVDALDLEGESGFSWLPFTKFELQIYNIRHVQQHTGELCERLGASEEIEIDWVGMRSS